MKQYFLSTLMLMQTYDGNIYKKKIIFESTRKQGCHNRTTQSICQIIRLAVNFVGMVALDWISFWKFKIYLYANYLYVQTLNLYMKHLSSLNYIGI